MTTNTDSVPPNFQAAPHAEESNESIMDARWNILNAAAKKDTQWWFFVLLIIGMTTVGFLYKDMRAERESMRLEITEVRNAQLSFLTAKNDAMMAALLNNTRALEANTQTLNRIETRSIMKP